MACADKFALRAVRATGGTLGEEDGSSQAQQAVAAFEARGSY